MNKIATITKDVLTPDSPSNKLVANVGLALFIGSQLPRFVKIRQSKTAIVTQIKVPKASTS